MFPDGRQSSLSATYSECSSNCTLFQVIAIVMDMFTDVDIFNDLLEAAARHVPVYILLDEHEAHSFVSMVINHKVNLDLMPVSLLHINYPVASFIYLLITHKVGASCLLCP